MGNDEPSSNWFLNSRFYHLVREQMDLYCWTMSLTTAIFFFKQKSKSLPFAAHFREENYPEDLDVASMLPSVWEKHPEVQLDAPVEEYHRGK